MEEKFFYLVLGAKGYLRSELNLWGWCQPAALEWTKSWATWSDLTADPALCWELD